MLHRFGVSGAPTPQCSLSLVIPAWNEETVIALAVDEALVALTQLAPDHELIIVDDGSTDRTAEIVRAASEHNSRIRLIQFPEHRGYGAALRAGFEASRCELVAFTDADCQFDLDDLGSMIPLTEKYEIVSGYRIDRQDSPLRCFYSWGYNTLVRGLLGCPLRDVDCALKVFRHGALLQILPESKQFFANTEMFTVARLKGISINEIGVVHRPRAAGSSCISIRAIPRTLCELMPFWWRRIQFGGRPTPELTAPSALAFALLMFVAGFLLFRGLAYPLIEPDEGRYAEIAREMWTSGDWIVPQLHHEPYLDKPPLFYWLCAGSFALWGASDWAARLVPAMAAWLTVGVTYVFGCRLIGRQSALLGTLALMLSIGFVCCGRFLILDSLLALLVTTSLFTAFAALKSDRFSWNWWILSAVCCGLGVLTKGPVAFILLAPPVIAHAWLTRHGQAPGVWRWSAYAGVVAIIALPWYLAAIRRIPGFVQCFFWEHNIARFVSGSNHPEPFWFYAPILFVSCMPWGLLLIPVAKHLAGSSRLNRDRRTEEVGFLVLWVVWCLAFFSMSRSKLPTYILPCLPAIMLLIGHYLQEHCSPFASNLFVRVRAHSIFYRGLLYLAASGLVLSGGLVLLELDGRTESLLHTCLWVVLLLGTLALHNRTSPAAVYGVFCLAAFAINAKITQDVFPTWANQRSVFGGSQQPLEALQHIGRSRPVACVAGEWGSIPFYLNRDDVLVFPEKPNAKVHRFLEQEQVSLLVIDDDVDLKQLSSVAPQHAVFHTLRTTPKATVLAVHVLNPARPQSHTMTAEARNSSPASRR